MAREEPPGVVLGDLVARSVRHTAIPPPTSLQQQPADIPSLRTEALEAATASLSLDAQKRAARDAEKKAAKAEAAEAKQADKLAKSVITIKRIERNKKKFVTAVIGLEAFGLDLKKVRRRNPPTNIAPPRRSTGEITNT